MNAIHSVLLVAAALALSFPGMAQEKDRQGAAVSAVRVGTFDSRLVAVAYARSERFEERLRELFAAIDRARLAGDEERVKELTAMGPALQARLHQQSFSTLPIDDILEHLAAELPEIARRSGVAIVISKWDIAYQDADARFVDVTEQMVAPFKPDEETRKILRELAMKKPVPLDDVKESGH